MEKLLKSTIKGFDIGNINFNSFGSSSIWEGCFEKKNVFSLSLIENSINIVKSFFGPCWEGFFAISALSYDDDCEKDEEIEKCYGKLYEKAKKTGYLRELDSDFESYLYGEIPLPASSLSLHFKREDYSDMCRLLMGHGGVVGQVFFLINLEIGIAIYPHGDIGFGFISFNENECLCKNILKEMHKYENDFVVINK